ncbi:TraB/GumN family protein [Paenibacillus profundus]|uniref:TraB/GumN family protein n=1 Tax=Paenibacillus profundus TaxID=1173085 RepID=A0ABS8YQS1_9BACL|nr:TraB/GumN family protein [Paenibacillus profundus]MCE5172975.1 TraB/GumN family protein [Paenibacillus profundus]
MKTSKWNMFKRSVVSGLAVLIAMLGFVIPAQANEGPAAVPQISSWSVKVLNEGEKYGIFPLAWYYDGTFKQPITQDKFQYLIEATSAKLDALELKKKGKAVVPTGTKEITRETVVNAVYGVLAQYELPESLEIDKYEPITFLQKKGIVNGTDKGLELDKPSTVEQAAVIASRLVEYTYDAVGGGAKGLLWKATKGQNTLYLLGSIHLGIPDMYPVQKNVRDAFQQSDTLWVEVNLQGNKDMVYFLESMAYSDGTALKDHVSKETYEKLHKVLEQLKLPKDTFDAFKPWAISNNLVLSNMTGSSEEMAQAAALGVDMYFTSSALLTGKPIHELEGLKFQADLFNNVPVTVQEKELNEALDQILTPTGKPDDALEQFKQWQQLWTKAELDQFTQSFTGSEEMVKSDSAQRLFGERDKNMTKKLMELLDKEGSSTHFVVVGAGHFVIKDMIIDQLKAKGYDVQFIK